MVADLALLLMREYCQHHQWPLNTYPGDAELTKELFARLPSQEAQKNIKVSYLSDKFVQSREHKTTTKTERRRSSKAGANDDQMDTDSGLYDENIENVEISSSEKPAKSGGDGEEGKKRKKTAMTTALTMTTPVAPTRRNASRSAKSKAKAILEIGSDGMEAESLAADVDSESETEATPRKYVGEGPFYNIEVSRCCSGGNKCPSDPTTILPDLSRPVQSLRRSAPLLRYV